MGSFCLLLKWVVENSVEAALLAVPKRSDGGLVPGGSDGAGEKLLYGFWIHFEGGPHRNC